MEGSTIDFGTILSSRAAFGSSPFGGRLRVRRVPGEWHTQLGLGSFQRSGRAGFPRQMPRHPASARRSLASGNRWSSPAEESESIPPPPPLLLRNLFPRRVESSTTVEADYFRSWQLLPF